MVIKGLIVVNFCGDYCNWVLVMNDDFLVRATLPPYTYYLFPILDSWSISPD